MIAAVIAPSNIKEIYSSTKQSILLNWALMTVKSFLGTYYQLYKILKRKSGTSISPKKIYSNPSPKTNTKERVQTN